MKKGNTEFTRFRSFMAKVEAKKQKTIFENKKQKNKDNKD